MDIQVQIPAALAALHNFIRQYDPQEDDMPADNLLDFQRERNLESVQEPMDCNPESIGELGTGPPTPNERDRANERRDKIAADMWEQYQQYLASRNG
jgi:hypothetical protein